MPAPIARSHRWSVHRLVPALGTAIVMGCGGETSVSPVTLLPPPETGAQARALLAWESGLVAGDVRPLRDATQFYAIDSVSGTLIARAAESGIERWRTARVRPAGATIASGIASPRLLAAGPVIVVVDSAVRAFDRATGVARWSATPTRATAGGGLLAAVTDDAVFVAGRSEVLRLDAATGTLRWRTPLPDTAAATPCSTVSFDADATLATVALAACGTRRAATVLGVASTTGAVRWRAAIPDSARARFAAQLLRSGGRTVMALDNAQLGALDEDGRDVWNGPTEAAGLIAPYQGVRPFAVAGQIVVSIGVSDVTGTDLLTGIERWRIRSSVLVTPERGGNVSAAATRAYVPGSARTVASVSPGGAWGWFVPAPSSTTDRPVYLLPGESDVMIISQRSVSRWIAPP